MVEWNAPLFRYEISDNLGASCTDIQLNDYRQNYYKQSSTFIKYMDSGLIHYSGLILILHVLCNALFFIYIKSYLNALNTLKYGVNYILCGFTMKGSSVCDPRSSFAFSSMLVQRFA